MDNLKKALCASVPFTAGELKNILKRFETVSIDKDMILLNENEAHNALWFVNSGCLALTNNTKGQERIVQIFTANSFAIDLYSHLQKRSENLVIQSLNKCELMILSKKDFDELYKNMQNWEMFIHRYTEEAFIFYATEVLQIKSCSNEERYSRLQHEQPELFHQIPLRIIARYLGMTSVGLSKLRGRIHGSRRKSKQVE